LRTLANPHSQAQLQFARADTQPKIAKELPSPCPSKEKCEAFTNTYRNKSEYYTKDKEMFDKLKEHIDSEGWKGTLEY